MTAQVIVRRQTRAGFYATRGGIVVMIEAALVVLTMRRRLSLGSKAGIQQSLERRAAF